MNRTSNSLIFGPWNHPLFNLIFFYVIYSLMFFAFYTIQISLVAFFHFLLHHQFNTIGDWTFRSTWELVLISKALAFYLTFKVIGQRFHDSSSVWHFLVGSFKWPHWNIFLTIFYLLTLIIWQGSPTFRETGRLGETLVLQIISYVGNVAFYGFDFLILGHLRNQFPFTRNRQFFLYYFLCPSVFYLTAFCVIPFIQRLDFLVIFHLFTGLVFLEFKDKGMTYPLAYVLLLAGPLGAFLGLDPVWGDLFSFFKMSRELPLHICLILWFTAYYYLFYSENHPFIKRLRPYSGARS